MDFEPKAWDQQQISRGASFLQSSWWGQFQAEVGARPYFLRGGGWSCLLLQKRNRIGSYLYSQYGPTVDSAAALGTGLAEIKDFAKRAGAAWLSLEPMGPGLAPDEARSILKNHGGRRPARHREPDMTRVIDLSRSGEELLASVSQSTRSFIRKNDREQFVSFRPAETPEEIKFFIDMLGRLSQRKNVNFFADSYFKKQAERLMPTGVMRLEFALVDDQPVAAAVFMDYGAIGTYLYAAALPAARKLNVSALLLWQALLNAKSRGLKKLDLYGIAPADAPASHPWAGFTSFKAKFGGQIVRFPGTWDIPLNSRYSLYKAAHQARRLIKNH